MKYFNKKEFFLSLDTFFIPDTFIMPNSITTFENREMEKLESEKQAICDSILKAMYKTKKLPD